MKKGSHFTPEQLERVRKANAQNKVGYKNKGRVRPAEEKKRISLSMIQYKEEHPFIQKHPHKRSADERKRCAETRRRNAEERKGIYYIIDGELYTAAYVLKTSRLKGTTIKKFMESHTPATQEEIDQWLADHLLDTIYNLELLKLGL